MLLKSARLMAATLALSAGSVAHADATNVGFLVSVYYDGQLWQSISYSTTLPPPESIRSEWIGNTRTIAKCQNGGLTGVTVNSGISVSVAPQGAAADGSINARIVLRANHINAIREAKNGSCTGQVVDADAAAVDRDFSIGQKPLTVLESGHFRAEVQQANFVISHQ